MLGSRSQACAGMYSMHAGASAVLVQKCSSSNEHSQYLKFSQARDS